MRGRDMCPCCCLRSQSLNSQVRDLRIISGAFSPLCLAPLDPPTFLSSFSSATYSSRTRLEDVSHPRFGGGISKSWEIEYFFSASMRSTLVS